MLNNKNGSLMLQLATVENHNFYIEVENGVVRANLTQMAKDFGTEPKDWLRTEESERYLNALSVVQKCRTADLVQVRQGGVPHLQGTWATHHNIIIEFASWLDPFFAIAVNELVFKLLTNQAVIAEPINGVWPLIQNGIIGYPRKEALQSVGRSATSGSAYGLKKKFPEQCLTLGRAACITAELFQWVIDEENQKKKALLMKSNQLNLAL